MSDIREAAARAMFTSNWDGPPRVAYDELTQEERNYYLRLTDAALSVARPLIEAEARERALREAVAVAKKQAANAHLHEFMDPEDTYAIGCHEASDAILALLPAPAEEKPT